MKCLARSVLLRGNMTKTLVKPLDQVKWCLRLVTVFLGCRQIYPVNRYFRVYNIAICVPPFPFKLSIMNHAVQVIANSYTHLNAVCSTIYSAKQSLNSLFLRYYPAYSGNFLLTFWDNLSVQSWVLDPWRKDQSVSNCHYMLRNIPEQHSSQVFRGGWLKWHLNF